MVKALEPPLDPDFILRKRKSIRAQLEAARCSITARIALLGGSTTAELKSMLELFLRNIGIAPVFYESQYNRYYEDAVFGNEELLAFKPDIALLHTTWCNITQYPPVFAPEAEVEKHLKTEFDRFQLIWQRLDKAFHCVIIQNNFDFPPTRVLGHLDASESYGRSHFLARLNLEFARHARQAPAFLVNDINFLSSTMGLDRWFDPEYWFSYKMALSPEATVRTAQHLASLIGAVYGKSKKCLVLDLDNTLWGGVIGDDGLAGLKLGNDSAVGEAYCHFQQYLKQLRERGVLLAVCSKNEPEIARQGFSHPDSVLRVEDFAAFKASWRPKYETIAEIAAELNIGLDSLVFADDNPMERESVAAQLPMVAVPEIGADVTRFAGILDRAGYFQPLRISVEDLNRASYYDANQERTAAQTAFGSYDDFLRSLEMTAEIAPFSPTYLERITQLINKTNQFNLTTRRYTAAEVAAIADNPAYVNLYGRLADKFGDNGLVSVIIGKTDGSSLHIDLWLMSCRVLKRGMEWAMFDALVARCRERGITRLLGTYLPTEKNKMVAGHYESLGFRPESSNVGASTRWVYDIPAARQALNLLIRTAGAADSDGRLAFTTQSA